MPNNAYASGTVMYSLDLGIFLTTSSNLCNLCSSSLRRFHAILEHLGEQYQDSIVLAKTLLHKSGTSVLFQILLLA